MSQSESWLANQQLTTNQEPALLIDTILDIDYNTKVSVPEQLHDEGGVLVALLVQGVQLRDRIVKCLKKEELNIYLAVSIGGLEDSEEIIS